MKLKDQIIIQNTELKDPDLETEKTCFFTFTLSGPANKQARGPHKQTNKQARGCHKSAKKETQTG